MTCNARRGGTTASRVRGTGLRRLLLVEVVAQGLCCAKAEYKRFFGVVLCATVCSAYDVVVRAQARGPPPAPAARFPVHPGARPVVAILFESSLCRRRYALSTLLRTPPTLVPWSHTHSLPCAACAIAYAASWPSSSSPSSASRRPLLPAPPPASCLTVACRGVVAATAQTLAARLGSSGLPLATAVAGAAVAAAAALAAVVPRARAYAQGPSCPRPSPIPYAPSRFRTAGA